MTCSEGALSQNRSTVLGQAIRHGDPLEIASFSVLGSGRLGLGMEGAQFGSQLRKSVLDIVHAGLNHQPPHDWISLRLEAQLYG